jgi:hypothetical protein
MSLDRRGALAFLDHHGPRRSQQQAIPFDAVALPVHFGERISQFVCPLIYGLGAARVECRMHGATPERPREGRVIIGADEEAGQYPRQKVIFRG